MTDRREARMAVDPKNSHVPEGIDPNGRPFVAPPVESLPLTKQERADLKRIIEELARERAAADGDR